jgi:hypothetical protein
MAIPGTLVHEGPSSVSQAQFDEIPDIEAAFQWLVAHSDVGGGSLEHNWVESGYESWGIWFLESVAGVAAELSAYGLDLYDQGSSKWYAFLPDDRTVA